MDYASQQMNAYPAAALNQAESPLQRIMRRIEVDAASLHGLASKLKEHADAVHGGVPETEKGTAPAPVRSGLVGSIEDAIDNLDRALMFASEQTERNCTLA